MDKDHPRICGEKLQSPSRSTDLSGSPPHMRGKEPKRINFTMVSGITPAYAGKSPYHNMHLLFPRDHPRICGEKIRNADRKQTFQGSPPHMRGKAILVVQSSLCLRITPAYAGKRLKRSRSTVPPVAIVPLFPSVCNKPVVSDGNPAGRDAPLFLPAENAAPASPAYNLQSL